MEKKQKHAPQTPDTLTFAERFSLRTNTVDWLLLIPNISMEYDLGRTEYNHWSLGLGVRYNWQTKHDFKPAQVYNMGGVKFELRYYWHTQKIDSTIAIYAHKKKNYLGRLFSTRRFLPKHLNTTYYRGAYVSADKYSFLLGRKGYQGTAITAGFLYGIVKPLYEFSNGNTIDLDLGVSAGICMTKYDEYRHSREDNCYPVVAQNGWTPVLFPVVSELRFAFIYRFGDYPLTKKYRWRSDVDPEYRDKLRNIATNEETERINKRNMLKSLDEVKKAFDKYYKAVYNDCLKEAQKNAEEAKKAEEARKQQAAEAKKQAAEEKKQAAEEKKQQAEEAKKQAKEEKKQAEENKKQAEEAEKQEKEPQPETPQTEEKTKEPQTEVTTEEPQTEEPQTEVTTEEPQTEEPQTEEPQTEVTTEEPQTEEPQTEEPQEEGKEEAKE